MQEAGKEGIFDFVIAGGGCAGLSLAWQMLQSGLLESRRLLILDKDSKSENDRTWCFWEKGEGPFESIVYHAWEHAWFFGPSWAKKMHLSPYKYKMIRADAFYVFVKKALEKEKNVVFALEKITDIRDGGHQVEIKTTENQYSAAWLFNSLSPKTSRQARYHYLLQHFVGWFIKTPKPFFRPDEPYLMDFRIPQKDECRFMYVLPSSETEALVEFTLFSEAHLPLQAYDAQIKEYLKEYLKLEEFEILHQEFGSIPMYSEPFSKGNGNRIVNIGTAGGQTKASTGYTFTRIQKHSKALVTSILKTNSPHLKTNWFSLRHSFYDRVLLHVLANKAAPAARIFQNLFRYNGASSIFSFLDEDSHFLLEYKIINTVPILPFMKAAMKELRLLK
jgi:lycopene beta-cyclase